MNYTNTDYRKRIANVKYANSVVKSCLRRMHIHDYIPGQVIYNLGEYPNKMTIRPTAYDHDLIRKLSENGVGLIQIHEEWNDAMRIMGADKFSSHDKDGLKEFIDLCHSFHIKVLPYLSSGFFDERDPDFTEKFVADPKLMLVQNYYRYRCCNAASPEWNQYLFDNLHRMMDEYAFDGIFNDMGYDRRDGEGNPYGMEEYDPYIEDLLVRMYSVVKNEYHGIVKLHIGELQLPVSNEKIYDYLWVGESIGKISENRFARADLSAKAAKHPRSFSEQCSTAPTSSPARIINSPTKQTEIFIFRAHCRFCSSCSDWTDARSLANAAVHPMSCTTTTQRAGISEKSENITATIRMARLFTANGPIFRMMSVCAKNGSHI